MNHEFLSWLDDSRDRPFFALLNYLDVHDPYVTVEPFHTRYSADAARGDVINFQLQPHAFRRTATPSAEQIQAEIDAYDGCLAYLDSEVGKGTTFRILMPRHIEDVVPAEATATGQAAGEQQPAAVAQVPDKEPRDLTGGSAVVLLVEDEEAVRRGGKRMLETRGYTVHEAGSGVEAFFQTTMGLVESSRYSSPMM